MRGHFSTQLATCSPDNARLFTPRTRQATWPRLGWLGAAILGLTAVLTLGACGSGYGGGYELPADSAGDTSGRLAIAWTFKGLPLTTDVCQSEHIDSMEVYVQSDRDSQDQVEFLSVICALDRYSMAMIPSGPVTVQVNAVHNLNNQFECTRYAGVASARASSQYAASATTVALLPVVSCP